MNQSADSAPDTIIPPPKSVEERLAALEEGLDRERAKRHRLEREVRRQGYDRDLLMHSLRYLVSRQPSDEDDGKPQLLAHSDQWERQRAEERRREQLEDEEDDTRPSAKLLRT